VQNYTLQGDFTMIGNTNLTQSPYDVNGNNSDNMVYVDIDNDGSTINSSMATLQLPAGVDPSCTEIVFAGLYWTGRPGNVGNSFSRTKTVRGALTSIDRQDITLTNGGRLIGNDSHHPDYYVSVGGNYSTSVGYVFYLGEESYEFVFRHNSVSSSERIRYRRVGTSAWTYVPATLPSGNTGTATFTTPVVLTAEDGNLAISISALYRSNNRYNSSTARVSVTGQYFRLESTTVTLNKNTIKFKTPGGTYQTITAQNNEIHYGGSGTDYMYTGYSDVTNLVRKGGFAEYQVGNIALVEGRTNGGAGFFGGWGMVVIYANPTMKWRDITVFDGFSYIEHERAAGVGETAGNLDVSGFRAAQAGPVNIKMGMMAGEGDRSIRGDFFQIRNRISADYTRLSHGGNTETNFFRGSIETGGNPRNPDQVNNFGVD